MQLETTITMPLIQVINIIGNIIIILLAYYVKFQVTKLETKINMDDTKMEEKILNIVNGKYLKTELYNLHHTNMLEKIDALHKSVTTVVNKIDRFVDAAEKRFFDIDHKVDAYQVAIDKKLIKLATIPCPYQESKKFLLEED